MCSKVVLVDDHVNVNHRRGEVNLLFALLFPPMSESVSYNYYKFSCLMLNSYSVERILSIVFISIFCTWLLHVQTSTYTYICTQEWANIVACHHIMNMHDGN